MKKIAKKGIAILIILLIAITTSNVYAQSTITVDKKTYLWTESQRQTKFHTTKGYAFCITPNRTGPSEGKTMTYKSKQSKGGVLYLFDKTGYSDSDYLATQLAIWLYDSNHMSEFWKNHSNLDVVKKAKALSAEASKNSNYTHTPSVKLTTSSSNLSITSDNKYYRSGVITVTMENATEAKLTLEGAPAGATIVNSNYSAISNATNNAKIYVQIPEEKVTGTVNFSIKAEANGQLAEIEREEEEAKAILGYFDVETFRYQCPDAFKDEASFETFYKRLITLQKDYQIYLDDEASRQLDRSVGIYTRMKNWLDAFSDTEHVVDLKVEKSVAREHIDRMYRLVGMMMFSHCTRAYAELDRVVCKQMNRFYLTYRKHRLRKWLRSIGEAIIHVFDVNMNRKGLIGTICHGVIKLYIGREGRNFGHIMETVVQVMRYVHFSDRYSPQEFFEGKRIPSHEEQDLYGRVFMAMIHKS